MKKLLLATLMLLVAFTSPEKIHLLYTTLNPDSISSHLAFYKLFPDSTDGKKALADAWKLLAKERASGSLPITLLSDHSISSVVTLITKAEGVEALELNPQELALIQSITDKLPNKTLKSSTSKSEEELLKLPSEEIDLSRALLLAQAADSPSLAGKIDTYEAVIDLMALQILARVPMTATPEQKIREINRFIFEEMGYRFPPHSVFVKNVDRYTYLPSVIDSRRGVCLGVSILYLSLAQRLNLPLEAITPPGHIYVRYKDEDKTINIETTARGIHIETEEYMGIEMRPFEPRTTKEVVGMAYVNEASVHWQNEQYKEALRCYNKALPYLEDDLMVKEFMGYNLLFSDQQQEAKQLLKEIYDQVKDKDDLAYAEIIEDYLAGKADKEAIKAAFLHVEQDRASLELKKERLEKALILYPKFRSGYFFLAVTWLQLDRYKEALALLEKYIDLAPQDQNAHYFLSQLYAMRSNYVKSWEHLHLAEALQKPDRKPSKTLKNLRKELAQRSPE
ncbi:MAG: transglutaminase family protein [Parachlamydiaceae bacterium]